MLNEKLLYRGPSRLLRKCVEMNEVVGSQLFMNEVLPGY